jgi:anaerobic magnesium-protoporphyrin IX monomethyl ester cyclase
MKLLFITTPIRPVPTQFPPMGVLSMIKYLRLNNKCEIDFYNIDANRPDYDEAIRYIIEQNPTILAISSVVSTAYAYTKKISLDIKAELPNTLIVLGGNLAASAEVILRKTGVDMCVLGEGEKIISNLVRHVEMQGIHNDFSHIPGLVLLGPDGNLVNTGYEEPLAKNELYDFDWSDLIASLAKKDDISRFIYDPFSSGHGGSVVDWFRFDERTYSDSRKGKSVAQLPGAKGCVARCTFCHRWDKGIRYIPVPLIMERLDLLIRVYDVGFLTVVDENFGTSKKWLNEFCEEIRRRDVIWSVAGMRVNCIDRARIQKMKDAGCASILYGMETGSPIILEIMEKRVKVEDNYNAIRWTVEAGLHTVIQLVIGMPGESPETIKETIKFASEGLTISKDQNPNWLSINYAQALPGTPLYEFARRTGLLGVDSDEEEYLISISDTNAHDEFTSINFTDYPTLVRHSWRPLIQLYVNYTYVKKYGLEHYHKILIRDTSAKKVQRETQQDQGFFARPRKDLSNIQITTQDGEGFGNFDKERFWDLNDSRAGQGQIPSVLKLALSGRYGYALIAYPSVFFHLRFMLWAGVLLREYKKHGLRYAVLALIQHIRFLAVGQSGIRGLPKVKTLRKLIRDDLPVDSTSNPAMIPLRKGR